MTIAAVSPAALPVEPGGEAAYELTVRNTGTVVDAFTVQPLGEAAAWTVVEPAELPLFPGAEGTVLLRFRPPRRADIPAGDVPWAVRISSREVPGATWVEEGLLQIAPFSEVTAELAPQTTSARGRGRGKSQLAIDNRGNVATEVRLFGGDNDGKVSVEVIPRSLIIEPGAAKIAKVQVRAKKGFWRGSPKSHPYRVVVDNGSGEPKQLPATLVQDTVVPAWLVKLLVALLVLAIILGTLWATVFKPTLEDFAKQAANVEADKVAKKEAGKAANKAVADVVKANPALNGGKPPVLPDPSADTPTSVDPLGAPAFFRLAIKPGDKKAENVLSKTEIFSVTDLFYENPEGDAGLLEIYKGNDLVYRTRLNNWRDYDQHRNAPLEFKPGEKLKLKVSCENKGAAANRPCAPAVSIAGFTRKPAE
jgi:hypothetical protein